MRGKRAGKYSPGRDGDDDGDDANRWLGTYGDAITLLMAFFVMLYAMSEVDVAKFEAFVRGLQDPFGNTAASDGMFDASASIIGDAGDAPPNDVVDDAIEPLTPPIDPPTAEEEETEDKLATDDLEQLDQVEEAIEASLASAGLGELASFRYDGRGLVLTLATDNVLFDSGSTEISPLGQELISAVAEPLSGFENDVFVEGHTDDVPIGRPGYTNWNLSTDRAVAVVSLLASQHRMEPDRLGAAGYAEYRPRVPNTGSEARAANRRVDVLVVAEGVSLDG